MPTSDSPDNCFRIAHDRATGEGQDYIHSLASELSEGLTHAGIDIEPDTIKHDLEKIAETEGMDVIRNPDLLKARLEVTRVFTCENPIINPEDHYNKILMEAYFNAMTNNNEDTIANIVRSLAYHFSAGFKSEGINISVKKIENLIFTTIEHNIAKMPFINSKTALIRSLQDAETLIQDLCIRLQLAGLLD